MMAGPGGGKTRRVTGLINTVQRRQRGDLSRTARAAFCPRHGSAFVQPSFKGDAPLKNWKTLYLQKRNKTAFPTDGAGQPLHVRAHHSQSFRYVERFGLFLSVLTATAAG